MFYQDSEEDGLDDEGDDEEDDDAGNIVMYACMPLGNYSLTFLL